MKTKVKFKPRGARMKITLTYEAARDLARLLRYAHIPSLSDLEDGLDDSGIRDSGFRLEWTGAILREAEDG